MRSATPPWVIAAEPEVFSNPPGGFDGVQFKWHLARPGSPSTFTLVQIGHHALMKANPDGLTRRTLSAVDTRGRSEVERHLLREQPPRVIEVSSTSNPWIVAERDG